METTDVLQLRYYDNAPADPQGGQLLFASKTP